MNAGIHLTNERRLSHLRDCIEEYEMKRAILACWDGRPDADKAYIKKTKKRVATLHKLLLYRAAL